MFLEKWGILASVAAPFRALMCAWRPDETHVSAASRPAKPTRGPNAQACDRPPKSRERTRRRSTVGRAAAVVHRSGRPRRRRHRALRRRSGFRDCTRARPRGAARALRQAAADVDRPGEPSNGNSARRGAAQPAHADQAGLRRRRRRAPVLPAAARALVQPRVPVGVADRGARAADPRPARRIAARGLLAGDARRRRDRLPRALDVVADHVAVAQRRPAPAGVLHVDRARDARAPAAGRARRLSRARLASIRTPSTRRTPRKSS